MNASNALPDAQTAYDTLLSNCNHRIFFQKLASVGIVPSSPQEAGDLVMLAGRLRVVENDPQVKQAAASQSRFAGPMAALDRITGESSQAEEIGLRKAAAALTQDPAVYNSTLALQLAEAQELAAQAAA